MPYLSRLTSLLYIPTSLTVKVLRLAAFSFANAAISTSPRKLPYKIRFLAFRSPLTEEMKCDVRCRPFNSLGEGVGDLEKKFPASACWKKKIACNTNDIEKKFLHCCKQEKKCCKAISSGLYIIPAKLQLFSG